MRLTWKQLNDVAGYAMLFSDVLQDLHHLLIGLARGLGTTQQGHVAGLDSEAEGIHGHIGTGFVDHAHHAQWDANLLHAQAVGASETADDLSHRIRQAHYLAQTVGNSGDALLIQGQTIQERIIKATLTAGFEILLVGSQDGLGIGLECISCIEQEFILLLGGQESGLANVLGLACLSENFIAFCLALRGQVSCVLSVLVSHVIPHYRG